MPALSASARTPSRKPARIDRASAVSLYEQIAAQLAEEIRSRRRKPFEQLPSEQALMEQHGVSRVTVRQAIRKLADAGLVVTRQGKGAFVAGALVSHELSALHGFYDGLVSQGYRPETSVLRFEHVRHGASAHAETGQFAQDVCRFRRLYQVNDLPIAIADVLVASFGQPVARGDVEQFPVYALIQNVIGRTVTRTTAHISACSADADAARLLRVARRSPVLRMDRSSFDEQGLLLETTRFRIQPEVFAFQLDVAAPLRVTSALRRIGA